MKHKLLYIVLDGMSDSLYDQPTVLEVAEKPALDELARRSFCGLMYTVGRGVAPESDIAVISILGYNPYEVYTGRGPLEALGAGLNLKEGYEVAFRANFATIDVSTRKIVDRRVGRNLMLEEARELARALDNLDLGAYGGYARVVATTGHRAVVIIGSRERRLSSMVSNSDPAYVRRGPLSVASERPGLHVRDIEPLDDTPEAKITAELANTFLIKAIEILSHHSINIKRAEKGLLPANAILLRDAGTSPPKVEPLSKKFSCKFAVLAEMPVEIGIGRALGAKTIVLDPPTNNPQLDYQRRLNVALSALKENDVVYVHLKGPDEPGHDGDAELKRVRIEEIDRYFIQPLINYFDKFAVLVTSDHATPPSKRAHTDDPVPVALHVPGLNPNGVRAFTERECSKGSLGIIEHGWLLLPMVLDNYLK